MMPNATCVGDRTVGVCDLKIPKCCSHDRSGTNGQGSGIFEAGGSAVHLLSHTGPCNCPHGGVYRSVGGSSLIESEGLPVTLVGHATVCGTCGMGGAHSTGCTLLFAER